MTGSAPIVDLPLPEGKSFDVVGLGVHHLFLLPPVPRARQQGGRGGAETRAFLAGSGPGLPPGPDRGMLEGARAETPLDGGGEEAVMPGVRTRDAGLDARGYLPRELSRR